MRGSAFVAGRVGCGRSAVVGAEIGAEEGGQGGRRGQRGGWSSIEGRRKGRRAEISMAAGMVMVDGTRREIWDVAIFAFCRVCLAVVVGGGAGGEGGEGGVEGEVFDRGGL